MLQCNNSVIKSVILVSVKSNWHANPTHLQIAVFMRVMQKERCQRTVLWYPMRLTGLGFPLHFSLWSYTFNKLTTKFDDTKWPFTVNKKLPTGVAHVYFPVYFYLLEGKVGGKKFPIQSGLPWLGRNIQVSQQKKNICGEELNSSQSC